MGDKVVRIKIEMIDEKEKRTIKLKLEKGMWSRGINLIYNNKYAGRVAMNKVTSRILKRLTEFFYE